MKERRQAAAGYGLQGGARRGAAGGRLRAGVATAIAAAIVAACGGAAPDAKAPAAAPPAAQEAAPAGGAAPESTATGAGGGAGAGGESPRVARSRAQYDLEQARRELASAGSDCAAACRALASMERAAKTLCDLADPEEPDTCEEAQTKLRRARSQVNATCGTCK